MLFMQMRYAYKNWSTSKFDHTQKFDENQIQHLQFFNNITIIIINYVKKRVFSRFTNGN